MPAELRSGLGFTESTSNFGRSAGWPNVTHVAMTIVAAQLALGADVSGDPPHSRVIEQQRFANALQQVDQVVMPADVRQFMQEKRFQMSRGQSHERADRNQDLRPKPADHGRSFYQPRSQQPHETADAPAAIHTEPCRRVNTCEKMLHTFNRLSFLRLNWFLLEPNPAYQELSLSSECGTRHLSPLSCTAVERHHSPAALKRLGIVPSRLAGVAALIG
jgi:hypothetical protein